MGSCWARSRSGWRLGGIFPLWLAAVIVIRYLLPAVVALVLLRGQAGGPSCGTRVSGQLSTALIIVLVGGVCLFRFMNQDATNVVIGAEIVIPIATVATFVHLGCAGAAVFAGWGPGKMALGRAKWGAGGTLHRQSALAGPNSRAEVWALTPGRGKRR